MLRQIVDNCVATGQAADKRDQDARFVQGYFYLAASEFDRPRAATAAVYNGDEFRGEPRLAQTAPRPVFGRSFRIAP
jgi:hypothetical protein